VTTAVCVAWDAVTTVVNAVIEVLESVLTWLLSGLAFLVDLIFSIPILGRVLKWIWNIVLTIVWGLVGIVDAILGAIGILPEKKLRVCVIMLRDERGRPVGTRATVVARLQEAIDIFRQEANVRIIPSGPFEFDSGFADAERATEAWIHTNATSSGAAMLDPGCNVEGAGHDLWLPGSGFELLASTACFYGNFRRLIGYGAPVVIVVVRDVDGGSTLGCALGPLTDYLVVEGSNPICIAHELGHSCNLWHIDESGNLMNPSCGNRSLHWWQVAILRNSRHVTYF
jgi:hypothetical protein